MVTTDKVFAGSIPEMYDRLMVPLIFKPYAADIVERVAAVQPQWVLETAAGTGVVTRALASRLPTDVHRCHRPEPAHARSGRPAA